ncbi:hypothetical protein jhhlp_002807 [Lomentospora prolificans]|uniref:Protein kinase domain-containing protein n=1 Tax=Lomentospora prolificans TaxID=41688 RepID=A0A2N3NEY6_9PEZI|nr:hypothetical protein jhhlp_002807 [Lomentospora prolificans]
MTGLSPQDSGPDSRVLQHSNGTYQSTVSASPKPIHVDTSSIGHTPRHATPLRTSFEASPTSSPERIVHPHAGSSSHFYASNPQFRSSTIAPSPPASIDPSSASGYYSRDQPATPSGSASSSLRYHGAVDIPQPPRSDSGDDRRRLSIGRTLHHKTSNSSLVPVSRTPSFKRPLSSSLGSASGASSLVGSPIISALGDVTPLPSPLLSQHSPGPWRKLGGSPPSRGSMSASETHLTASPRNIRDDGSPRAPQYLGDNLVMPGPAINEQKAGANGPSHKPQHSRGRSISLYVPDPLLIPKRHGTVSGAHVTPEEVESAEPQLRREMHLAEARGITPTVAKPPTPPPSESSKDAETGEATLEKSKRDSPEIFKARDRFDGKKRKWRAVRFLGQGTFSRVILATSQIGIDDDGDDSVNVEDSGAPTPTIDPDRKTLVAVKVCEHGPRGGASEDRIEMSLKRELEIMKCISHPSLVHLKAWSIEPTRALLVLSYCPGGDLFDVATGHRELLKPSLLRRMFAELMGAVQYLHKQFIVHRDIKLENVLVNMPATELADPTIDWTKYPHSVITLTDLGLSRRIAEDEKLETRCGSDDYAAPEVIMGQPYDGRATDAWSLGVLLYALLEARLPFDPTPNMSDAHRMRSRTSHRIARVEWRWVEYGGDEGDHEADIDKFKKKDLLGAMEITEGLLKRARSRWTIDKVASSAWVAGAIDLPNGLVFREEEKAEEVS